MKGTLPLKNKLIKSNALERYYALMHTHLLQANLTWSPNSLSVIAVSKTIDSVVSEKPLFFPVGPPFIVGRREILPFL